MLIDEVEKEWNIFVSLRTLTGFLYAVQGDPNADGQLVRLALGSWAELLLRSHGAAHSLQQLCSSLLDDMAIIPRTLANPGYLPSFSKLGAN